MTYYQRGRSKVFAAGTLGAAVAPNLWWLFLGRVISGVTAANVTAAFAYIADVTPPDQRGKAFGMIGAAFGVGFVLGPAVGGVVTCTAVSQGSRPQRSRVAAGSSGRAARRCAATV